MVANDSPSIVCVDYVVWSVRTNDGEMTPNQQTETLQIEPPRLVHFASALTAQEQNLRKADDAVLKDKRPPGRTSPDNVIIVSWRDKLEI